MRENIIWNNCYIRTKLIERLCLTIVCNLDDG